MNHLDSLLSKCSRHFKISFKMAAECTL